MSDPRYPGLSEADAARAEGEFFAHTGPVVSEMPTALAHEREPHCAGCWTIHYRRLDVGGSPLVVICNACGEERPLSLDGSVTELEMLREFYDAWCRLHTIRRAPIHRRQMEQAAQALVDIHHAIKLFRDPVTIKKPVLEVVR